MRATSGPLPTLDDNADLNQLPADSPPYIIDFFTGRDRLLEEIDNIKRSESRQQQFRHAASPYDRSVELFDPLEDWLYSLISAAALVSVLLGILCMANLTTPQMQGPRPTPGSHTESLPVVQKAG
jgi:hypothetical protein